MPAPAIPRPSTAARDWNARFLGVYTHADIDIASIHYFIGRLSDLLLD